MSDVTLTIDGRQITVPAGTLVIRAAEQLGVYVPRFCDHPYLDPLGACRQCLVEIEGQRKPLTACTTAVTEGMIVKTQMASQIAADAQKGVLEFLLINHPLDCPMCDKGGECPLQDQALAYGPGDSRFIEPKRRYQKPVPVSPLVYLDRERCVLCARCTRFANEISGDPFIELFERGALEQVAIFEDEPYDSVYSGNVIQICPVGALTSADFRFKARPFDMTSHPSVCNHCASGCNLTVQQRRGQIVRVLASDNPEVNEEWSCDKGRFGHAYITRPERILEPMVRKADGFVAVSWAEAIRTVAERIDATKRDGGAIGVLAGDRLPDEDAYMLSRFARTVLGTNDIDTRLRATSDEEDEVLASSANAAPVTYQDIEAAKLVFIAGLDAREESPILFLRLRKAITKRGVPMVEMHGRRTKLASAGAQSLVCVPGTEAGPLLAVARLLVERGVVPAEGPFARIAGGLNATALAEQSGVSMEGISKLAEQLGSAGDRAVILVGERLATSPSAFAAAFNVAVATGAKIARVPRRAGGSGALWAGLHPGLLPGGRRVSDDRQRLEVEAAWRKEIPSAPGRDGRALLDAIARKAVGLLYLVAADPAVDTHDATLGRRAMEAGAFTVAHDILPTASNRYADVLLPATAVPEREGTFTDWEGRAQPFVAGIDPPGLAQGDWEILAAISAEAGVQGPRTINDVRREMRSLARPHAPGEMVPVGEPRLRRLDEAHPFTLLTYPLAIGDGVMLEDAADLLRTAEGAFVEMHAEDAKAIGVTDGARVRLTSSCGVVEAPARLTRGVSERCVFVPAGQGGLRAFDLLDAGERVTLVSVQRCVPEGEVL